MRELTKVNTLLRSPAMDNTAVLDGFMVTGGKHPTGGGVRNVYASPTLRNVVMTSNQATKQLDFDGSYEYGPIRVVTFDADANVRAFPNPARETVTLELSDRLIGSRVRLISTAGVVLQEVTVKERVFSIRLDGYPAGIYLLHTSNGEVLKVMKE